MNTVVNRNQRSRRRHHLCRDHRFRYCGLSLEVSQTAADGDQTLAMMRIASELEVAAEDGDRHCKLTLTAKVSTTAATDRKWRSVSGRK